MQVWKSLKQLLKTESPFSLVRLVNYLEILLPEEALFVLSLSVGFLTAAFPFLAPDMFFGDQAPFFEPLKIK